MFLTTLTILHGLFALTLAFVQVCLSILIDNTLILNQEVTQVSEHFLFSLGHTIFTLTILTFFSCPHNWHCKAEFFNMRPKPLDLTKRASSAHFCLMSFSCSSNLAFCSSRSLRISCASCFWACSFCRLLLSCFTSSCRSCNKTEELCACSLFPPRY